MRAAIAALINGNFRKEQEAKKIYYDRCLIDENNEKTEVKNEFYDYLDN